MNDFDLSWMVVAADTNKKKAELAIVLAKAAIAEAITFPEKGAKERVFHYRDIIKTIKVT